ncbi:hypothetical protein [Sedimentimonas flavescens]|uniref:hypothetical protein n=1 Tax=Sedimentimonas flavescens TaxID=2851012 RepID=UPI001C49FB48|nr:hypothetical protein [Sedimentimonas flavescens]MBW0159381.1 hypothetical protein [Sedimentimonas flavescens]
MAMRSTKSTVTFEHPFLLSGYTDELPAGDYDVVVEEELLEGLSFAAYRRTATYLTVRGKGRMAGLVERRPTSELDLETALELDRRSVKPNSETALSPSEDLE